MIIYIYNDATIKISCGYIKRYNSASIVVEKNERYGVKDVWNQNEKNTRRVRATFTIELQSYTWPKLIEIILTCIIVQENQLHHRTFLWS